MRRTELLLHPAFLVSLLALIVNDRLLKSWWPGLITGKLSDFVGPFVAAIALGVVLGRRHLAIGVTAIGFAALQLSPTVAALATPVLGGITRPDPTDLVGLLALAPAYRLLRPQSTPGATTEATTDEAGDDDVVGDRGGHGLLVRRILLIPVAAVTMFAVTATSCLDAGRVEDLVVLDGGALQASLGPSVNPFHSVDGGRTWTLVEPSVNGDPAPEPPPTRQTEGCLDDGRCYRTIYGERVEERVGDGPWTTAYEFSGEDRRRFELRSDSCSGHGLSDDYFGFLAITPGGGSGTDSANSVTTQTVVVGMSDQGVLVLDTSSGEWTRHAVGWIEPISLFGPSWLSWFVLAPLVAIALSPALWFVTKWRGGTTSRAVVATGVGGGLAAGVGVIFIGLILLTLGSLDYVIGAAMTTLGSIAALVIALVVAVTGPGQPPPPTGR